MRGLIMLPENLLGAVINFAYTDTEEWLKAQQEFLEFFQEREPTEEELERLQTAYVFSRKHSVHKKTFVRLFVECFEELYGKEWSRDIMMLEENFDSYFEITKIEGELLTVKDLFFEETFEVESPFEESYISEGYIIGGRIFTWKDSYFFFGPLLLFEEEDARENIKTFTDVARESFENATQSFLEYFGTNVVIFENRAELEKKLNEFLYWFFKNKTLPGVFKEDDSFTPVTFEEVDGKKEIGLIIDYDMGQIVIPGYGYAVNLFSGKWDDVPDYEGMAKNILYKDEIPSYFIKELIEENPESSVSLYSQFFPTVKSKEDLVQLFQKCKRDWGRKPRRQGTLFEE